MDFLLANQMLESVRDDLQDGAITDALEKLAEVTRLPRDVFQEDGTGKVWKKVRPGALDVLKKAHAADKSKRPETHGGGAPTTIHFKSALHAWKEHLESGGEDSPEALGGFLHKHFGDRKWDHKKAMEVARKAHKADKDTARRAADHYVRMNQGKHEAVKTKMRFFRRQHAEKK